MSNKLNSGVHFAKVIKVELCMQESVTCLQSLAFACERGDTAIQNLVNVFRKLEML